MATFLLAGGLNDVRNAEKCIPEPPVEGKQQLYEPPVTSLPNKCAVSNGVFPQANTAAQLFIRYAHMLQAFGIRRLAGELPDRTED
jgi:hypothetical protein